MEKNIILLQAKYNQYANSNLFALLEQIDSKILTHNMGTYYKSILGTIEHYLTSSIVFFARNFSGLADKNICIQEIMSFLEADFVLKSEYKNNLAALKMVVQKVDSKMIEIIENMSDFDKDTKLEIGSFSITKNRAQLLLTFLNHNTHHRGEISAMLDILGVSNNFAGMLMM
ncbi:DinB family protein [Helicobacter anatolicus]|uniref:DinB family protein n=1 Tax=Helicobacter anatolicus TaxID=2905874 RepID=UPI001E5C17B8|nr:DinB family protein [Helicobacter anatolicus]MCE3038835.1 damage-inducible protein DinB [Helicobacter anatolicus]